MYRIKPYHENVSFDVDSISPMYKIKSYYNDIETSSGGSVKIDLKEFEELLKIQNKNLRKLTNLCDKTNQLCDNLHLDHLMITNVQNSSSLSIENVHRLQEIQSKRLEKLSSQINKLCLELNLGNLIIDLAKLHLGDKKATSSTHQKPPHVKKTPNINLDLFKDINRIKTKVNKNKSIVDDFVIELDPQYVPYNLFNYFDQMTLKYKCFIKFHKHNTVLNDDNDEAAATDKIDNISFVFDKLNLSLSEARISHDFGFTFIWKKRSGSKEPCLTSFFSAKSVFGEEKIVASLNGLLPAENGIAWDKLKTVTPLITTLKQI